jgi:hypothetical protein
MSHESAAHRSGDGGEVSGRIVSAGDDSAAAVGGRAMTVPDPGGGGVATVDLNSDSLGIASMSGNRNPSSGIAGFSGAGGSTAGTAAA